MPRRSSPGQPKISRRPTASDRARRQQSRRMQAAQIDQTPLHREKTALAEPNDPLVSGQSGDNVNEIGGTTTSKMSVAQYNEQIKLDKFKVSDQPDFLQKEEDDSDIDSVQSKFFPLIKSPYYNLYFRKSFQNT